ncbi:MAG: hypothetical protein ACRC1H_15250 [Caldilineaceae bacterium]
MSSQTESNLSGRTYLIPNMCDHAFALAAAMEAFGIQAEVLPMTCAESATLGSHVTLGRECLPCLLVVGDVIARSLSPGFDPATHALFITTSNGPCRFGQYQMLYRQLLDEHGLADMAIVGPNAENSYMGFGERPGALRRLAWEGLIAIDLLHEALLHIRPYEKRSGEADRVYANSLNTVLTSLRDGGAQLRGLLQVCAAEFGAIAVDRSRPRPLVGITGEIYVRLNRFANRDLILMLEALGVEVRMASVMEWGYYINWHFVQMMGMLGRPGSQATMWISDQYQRFRERRLRAGLAHLLPTGPEPDSGRLVANMRRYGNPAIECETVMTLGKAVAMAEEGVDGIINVMPFSCMAGIIASGLAVRLRRDHNNLPWLELSYDLQRTTNLQTRLEAFVYQTAHRHAQRTGVAVATGVH